MIFYPKTVWAYADLLMLLSLDNVYSHLVLIGHVYNAFIFLYLIFLKEVNSVSENRVLQ